MEELFYYLNIHALNIFIDGRVIIILKKTYSYSILLMVRVIIVSKNIQLFYFIDGRVLIVLKKLCCYFILLMIEFFIHLEVT